MTTKLTEKEHSNLRSEIDLISKILDRAEKRFEFDRITAFIDMRNAHRVFNLDLEKFLIANQSDFSHDFIGIRNSVDRTSYPVTNFDGFLPRHTKG
ncbi:hypothetical protein [Enterococcus sp. AZ196]|uniref:DUF6874 family protein n=1 Tax=Enterococcus sp. AZ196 TaxID=2774659 RepID=UPI003D29B108